MTGESLAQAPWEAVRDHLRRGGSPSTAMYVLLAVLSLAALLLIVHRLQERGERQPPVSDPRGLFRRVLHDLGLNVVERDLLRRMASDLRLENPTVMLLSPTLFERYVRKWREALEERGGVSAPRLKTLQSVAVSLFGAEARHGRSRHHTEQPSS